MNAELLAPAGSERSAVAALTSGADAVYLGLKQFSARSSAENFDADALTRTLRLAHLLGARVYVALNTLVKDGELEGFFSAARAVWNAGADAILLQDLFLGRELKKRYPEMTLHLSTQAGCCNVWGAEVAKDYGFTRAVLARETPLSDIEQISKILETEVFVQGALCTAFSGQCYFSSFAGNNSGNRGRCKQPCRKQYRIDRMGYENSAYALSPCDLSVGERLGELLDAGVCSLKIEGRMRRPEYVGAAVKYYRALLRGRPAEEQFCDLRRAYNRGDYTKGLAFGQEHFLSREVQGHIGEPIGTVTLRHGMPVCRTSYRAEKGDGFKILRDGREVGGAAFAETLADGFALATGERLKAGDEVRLTTSVRSNARALLPEKRRPLRLKLKFFAGELPEVSCAEFCYRGAEPLIAAERAPLTAEELAACFSKTDGLPFDVTAEVETAGAFLPKSALNGLRRAFYAALTEHLCPARAPLEERAGTCDLTVERGTMSAVIGSKPQIACDIFIYKPFDYAHLKRPAGKTVYLWLPPLFTAADMALVRDKLREFDGICTEGYYGIALARQLGLPLFAGTGFNLTNRIAVAGVMEVAKYFALSKELSAREQDALAAPGAFVLAAGDIKLMDLGYCPFERTCAACDKRNFYRLTDEEGRKFPLRRYRIADMGCRFEVYNCAALKEGATLCSRLYDQSAAAARGGETTNGHRERSML